MILVLNGPYWFRGFDAILGILFALITFLIAAVSYKAYKITEEKKYSYFSVSFFLMSLAFFLTGIFEVFLTTHVWDLLSQWLSQFDLVFLAHMLLIFLAYVSLLIITLKITDRKVIALLFSLILLFTLFSYQYYLKFHIISFLLLFFLSYQFYTNYLEKKQFNAKLVFIAFYLLTCAEVFFLAIIYDQVLYVVGALLQLLGYILLFYVFVQVVYHGGTKRKT